ncbi:hypothetical protein POM88_008326 [Heracleum sosnowskyi]|uniref:Uncharacterized protein n=1 Tax=Heracleum sosnowskyi TaxID=360622 RepID=A0AAD8N8H0_9APIA|nr:hypothetical protein POM88_008326 [Heracleum sosnowskyi]
MNAFYLLAPIARRLEGKVAIITGGARGLGQTAARQFLKHGAKVVIGDVQDELAHSLCKEIDDESSLSYIHCDITKDSNVETLVNSTLAKHRKLDIMFANAGISSSSEVDTPVFRKEFGFNDEEAVKRFVLDVAPLKGVNLDAEDVAAAAVYLESDEAKYVSVLNLVTDYSTTKNTLMEAIKRKKSSSQSRIKELILIMS